jgi:hypothetical protein
MRIVVLAVSLALAGCASEGAAKPERVSRQGISGIKPEGIHA